MLGGLPLSPPPRLVCLTNTHSRSELIHLATAKEREKYEENLAMVPEMMAAAPDFAPGGVHEPEGAEFGDTLKRRARALPRMRRSIRLGVPHPRGAWWVSLRLEAILRGLKVGWMHTGIKSRDVVGIARFGVRRSNTVAGSNHLREVKASS
jgi:hypothetical protein